MMQRSSLWRVLIATSLTLFMAVTTAAYAQHKHPLAVEHLRGRPVVAKEVLVRFYPAAQATAIRDVERTEDIDATELVGDGSLVLFHSRSRTTRRLVRDLAQRPDVRYAEPNFYVRIANVPNDTYFGELWGMQNTGQEINFYSGTPGCDISAVLAWDVTTGSRDSVVAVIDTGTDYMHPDLAANMWAAPKAFNVTIGGQTMTCPAGAHGFNAITNTFDPMDDNDHGTHTAGTIGAVGNNGIGVCGVNWVASMMACKFLDADGYGTTANAINAIEFTIQARQALGQGANVRVLSNSWGGDDFSQAMLDEINKVASNEMLLVAAAGNDTMDNDMFPFYPASYQAPNVISVAATEANDYLAMFSNYGATTVHLGAPGNNILSTVIPSEYFGEYDYFSGTSMATPHVSGAAALILSIDPTLTMAEVKNIILSTVDPVPSLDGWVITGGRLNLNAAVRAVAPKPDFGITVTPDTQSVSPGGSTSYTTTVSALHSFTGVVNLTVTGLPSGATATFTPPSVSSAGRSTLAISTSTSTPVGTYTLTITGTSGSLQHTTTVTLKMIAPTLSSLSPGSVNAGGPAFTLTVKGTGFSSTDSVHWKQGTSTTALTTTYVSATQLKASVPASLIATPGKATITVVTSSGVASNSKTITIKVTSLKLTSATLTRNSTTGVYTATLSLKNIGYLMAPTVKITKSSLGAANTTTVLPVTVGNIAAGATANAVLTYPSTAGSSGTVVILKVSATFTGGAFSGSLKVTLP